MDEADKKLIEEQLTLRERVLTLKKKQQELNKETLRRWGLFLSALIVFALCGWVIWIGMDGSRICSNLPKGDCNTSKQCTFVLSWKSKSKEKSEQPKQRESFFGDKFSKNKASIKFSKPVDSDDKLLPAMHLAFRGLFILSGLGVAALFAACLARNSDEE